MAIQISSPWNSPGHVTYSYNGTIFNGYIGNFWSEYVGDDLDGNGIGDAPYPIPGPSGDTDNYPLLTYPLPFLPDQCISGRKINNITSEGIAGWTISLYNDTGSPLRNISTTQPGGTRSAISSPDSTEYARRRSQAGLTSLRPASM
jgi:hypothetical protein